MGEDRGVTSVDDGGDEVFPCPRKDVLGEFHEEVMIVVAEDFFVLDDVLKLGVDHVLGGQMQAEGVFSQGLRQLIEALAQVLWGVLRCGGIDVWGTPSSCEAKFAELGDDAETFSQVWGTIVDTEEDMGMAIDTVRHQFGKRNVAPEEMSEHSSVKEV
jgi:hypothetical protein